MHFGSLYRRSVLGVSSGAVLRNPKTSAIHNGFLPSSTLYSSQIYASTHHIRSVPSVHDGSQHGLMSSDNSIYKPLPHSSNASLSTSTMTPPLSLKTSSHHPVLSTPTSFPKTSSLPHTSSPLLRVPTTTPDAIPDTVPPVTPTNNQAKNPSFYRRELPSTCVHFNSPRGREMFKEAVVDGTMECYFPLSEQFLTQAEPAYCAISTLTMCLNALAIDPRAQWRRPWRWFSEELVECCRPLSAIQLEGMTFSQFSSLARCNGVHAEDYRADLHSIEHFRETVIRTAMSNSTVAEGHASDSFGSSQRGGLPACLVVSYSRKAFQQTGDGHMSPIGGYHRASDSVLVLDVARFKYPPYWVTVQQMWDAMLPQDKITNNSRGYCLLSPIPNDAMAIPMTEISEEVSKRNQKSRCCGQGAVCDAQCNASSITSSSSLSFSPQKILDGGKVTVASSTTEENCGPMCQDPCNAHQHHVPHDHNHLHHRHPPHNHTAENTSGYLQQPVPVANSDFVLVSPPFMNQISSEHQRVFEQASVDLTNALLGTPSVHAPRGSCTQGVCPPRIRGWSVKSPNRPNRSSRTKK